MIPKAATGGRATGTSFRGVHQYINHDKREEGEEIRTIRGGHIAMIFQDPMSSLTPVFSAGFHILEAVNLHRFIPGETPSFSKVELRKGRFRHTFKRLPEVEVQ